MDKYFIPLRVPEEQKEDNILKTKNVSGVYSPPISEQAKQLIEEIKYSVYDLIEKALEAKKDNSDDDY